MVYGIIPDKDILLKYDYSHDIDIENPRDVLGQVHARMHSVLTYIVLVW